MAEASFNDDVEAMVFSPEGINEVPVVEKDDVEAAPFREFIQ